MLIILITWLQSWLSEAQCCKNLVGSEHTLRALHSKLHDRQTPEDAPDRPKTTEIAETISPDWQLNEQTSCGPGRYIYR